jgi:hypothetical protein
MVQTVTLPLTGFVTLASHAASLNIREDNEVHRKETWSLSVSLLFHHPAGLVVWDGAAGWRDVAPPGRGRTM